MTLGRIPKSVAPLAAALLIAAVFAASVGARHLSRISLRTERQTTSGSGRTTDAVDPTTPPSEPATRPASREPETQPAEGGSRFAWVDVFIDPAGKPLAAYQFELSAVGGDVTLVGVEGGEHKAFAEPPYYDPAALARSRIVIAAFNTGDDLPSKKSRVARVMVRLSGPGRPKYSVTLQLATSSDEKKIENAAATSSEGAAQ